MNVLTGIEQKELYSLETTSAKGVYQFPLLLSAFSCVGDTNVSSKSANLHLDANQSTSANIFFSAMTA